LQVFEKFIDGEPVTVGGVFVVADGVNAFFKICSLPVIVNSKSAPDKFKLAGITPQKRVCCTASFAREVPANKPLHTP